VRGVNDQGIVISHQGESPISFKYSRPRVPEVCIRDRYLEL
jgi:hypothetical protein